MYDAPQDLARAAIGLLKLSYQEEIPASTVASIELGASTMCNHVWDWHEKKYGPSRYAEMTVELVEAGQPVPGKKVLYNRFKNEFSTAHPQWEILRQISNGVKHAKPLVADNGNVNQREIEWEDDDWWNASHGVETLFILINGKWISVSATIVQFVSSYLGEPV